MLSCTALLSAPSRGAVFHVHGAVLNCLVRQIYTRQNKMFMFAWIKVMPASCTFFFRLKPRQKMILLCCFCSVGAVKSLCVCFCGISTVVLLLMTCSFASLHSACLENNEGVCCINLCNVSVRRAGIGGGGHWSRRGRKGRVMSSCCCTAALLYTLCKNFSSHTHSRTCIEAYACSLWNTQWNKENAQLILITTQFGVVLRSPNTDKNVHQIFIAKCSVCRSLNGNHCACISL